MAVAMCPLSRSAEGARARQTNEVAGGIAFDLQWEERGTNDFLVLAWPLIFDDIIVFSY